MRIRSQTGAGTIGIILAIAFGILLPIGILGFEFLRYSVAQQELRSVCDAAALSGAAAIATTAQKGLTYTDVQNQAMDSAAITFKQNSVYGNPLTDTKVNRNGDNVQSGTPKVGETFLNFVLLDQNGNAVKTGDPAAKIVQIEALYGYSPALLPVFGIGPVVVNANSKGGLPQLDLVLCYDVSGSMDDATKVTFVKRWYDPASGYVKYTIAKGGSTGTANGEIYGLQVPPDTGTRLNAVPPENLSTSNYTGSTGNKYPLYFRPDLRAKVSSGASELGAPPGNYDSSDPSNINGNGVNPNVANEDYTDVVVNLDGNDVFGGWTDAGGSGFNFANIGMLVEAQRGNLDNGGYFSTSQCGKTSNPVFSGVTIPATSGSYKAVYDQQARAMVSPMSQAQSAASNFFNTMNVSANSHFALIAFSDGIGKPTAVWGGQPGATNAIIDPGYPAGGTGTFPLPLVPLDSTDNHYSNVQTAVGTLVATGKTAIADSLNEALAELTPTNGLTRAKATRAIVLFTDGEPNLPGGGGGASSPAATAAYTAADAAAKANIRVYCIGLSQNALIKPTEDAILGKIATTTGGQYIAVTNASQLDAAFQKIAKSLVVLK
jgi:hypothetical protein